MLRLLNDTFALEYSHSDLLRLAGQLGADCPFFIGNTASFASGTGDVLEPVSLSLDNYFLLLVKPDITISTKSLCYDNTRQPEVSLERS